MGKGWNRCRERRCRPSFPKNYLLHASPSNKNNWSNICPHTVNRWTCRTQTVSPTLSINRLLKVVIYKTGDYLYLIMVKELLESVSTLLKKLWVPTSGLIYTVFILIELSITCLSKGGIYKTIAYLYLIMLKELLKSVSILWKCYECPPLASSNTKYSP
jgi:hypothetical protein